MNVILMNPFNHIKAHVAVFYFLLVSSNVTDPGPPWPPFLEKWTLPILYNVSHSGKPKSVLFLS